MKQMKLQERNRIEFLTGCGWPVARIAKDLGRNESTIARELLNRRIESDKRYGCSNRLCAHFDECSRTLFNGFDTKRLRKNAPKCFGSCPDFREAACHRLARSPYVCNGCEHERNCPLPKRYYIASAAQANYEGTLRASRSGVRPDDEAVVGSVSGKVLFTMTVHNMLPLAFLGDAKTSQTCTRVYNMLWELAGPSLFRRMFRCLVLDNGTEFSDPEMIENYRPDPIHNPYRLEPRGIRVFYCDPYCSTQKPHVERFHLEFRRILQKGTSFNPLTQEQVNLVISHIDSYPRESLGGRTPYDAFVEEFGDEGREFLGKLGIVRIPANEVTLHPFLLGQKFQRQADRAVLRKNGVTRQK